MDSALQLMSAYDLAEITLEQLTHASGVSAFDLIRHYRTKENILAAVLERELELIAGAVPSPEFRFPTETLQDELQVLARIMLQEYGFGYPLWASY
jgi:AcrR family transcriptional regulator